MVPERCLRGKQEIIALGMFRYPSIKLAVLAGAALALQSLTAGPSADDLHFFEQKIQPLLADHCFKCHSHAAEKIKG